MASRAAESEVARRPVIDLRGADVGSFVLAEDGTAHLRGAVTGDPFEGRANVEAIDT
jgi:hypothetical protein